MASVSLRDIARKAGVSEMTVSRALRAHPEVSAATRARIVRIAEKLGYQPDPQIRKMMDYMRRSKTSRMRESLAFLWLDARREDVSQNPFVQSMLGGIHDRATARGFGVEQFFLTDSGLSIPQTECILNARGVNGIILSPLLRSAKFELSLNWEQFATVVIGRGQVGPPLHRVSPDHYQGMAVAMKELIQLGYRRIGLCAEGQSSLRQDRQWEGSFVMHHPLGISAAAEFILIEKNLRPAQINHWVRKVKPEIILFHGRVQLDDFRREYPATFRRLVFANLDWHPLDSPPEIGGINQHYEIMGANAVDLVTAHVLRNDRGLPQPPKLVLCEGTWVPGRIPPIQPNPRELRRD